MTFDLDQWQTERRSHEMAIADKERAEWLASHPDDEPWPLDFPYPDCSVCGLTTYHDGDSFRCDPCGISWSDSGEGAFDQCEATGPDLARVLSWAFGALVLPGHVCVPTLPRDWSRRVYCELRKNHIPPCAARGVLFNHEDDL